MKAAQTPRDMVSTLECMLATLERRTSSLSPTITSAQASGRAQEEPLPQCLPQYKSMLMELECDATARPFKPWLAGCALHTNPRLPAPTITLKLNGLTVPALVDSGSASVLSQTSLPC